MTKHSKHSIDMPFYYYYYHFNDVNLFQSPHQKDGDKNRIIVKVHCMA